MLLDLISESNYIMVNMKLLHIFTIKTSVYCSFILSIYKKANDKGCMYNSNYFKLDRDYVYKMINISIDEQKDCDNELIDKGVLKVFKGKDNMLSLDTEKIVSLISNESVKENEDKGGVKKVSKNDYVINSLKNSIINSCSNEELSTAFCDWIDSIYAKPWQGMSKKVVLQFQKEVDCYADGDLDVALSIVNIATINGWRNCSYAIKEFERSKKNISKVRTTIQKTATNESVNKNDVF